jgi:hypothetical protein
LGSPSPMAPSFKAWPGAFTLAVTRKRNVRFGIGRPSGFPPPPSEDCSGYQRLHIPPRGKTTDTLTTASFIGWNGQARHQPRHVRGHRDRVDRSTVPLPGGAPRGSVLRPALDVPQPPLDRARPRNSGPGGSGSGPPSFANAGRPLSGLYCEFDKKNRK